MRATVVEQSRALVVFSSLVAAVLPASSLSARQPPAVQPPTPVAAQQTPGADSQAPADEPADSGRRGLRGWLRERLQPPDAEPVPAFRSGLGLRGGTVISGSGLAGGARYRLVDALPFGLDAELGGMVSVRAYQEYSIALGWLERQRTTLAFDAADTPVASIFNVSAARTPGTAAYLDVRHRFYPRHRFFGSGMESRVGNEADYTLSGTSIDAVWQRQFTRTVGLSARVGWMGLHVGEGHDEGLVDVAERFVSGERPGWDHQPRFITVGAGLVRDGRDNPQAPADGWFAGASLRRFAASSASGATFTRATTDVRTYQRLAVRGVLAVRALASADLGAAGTATPFYLQPSLGSPQTLRGYHAYRFADRALVHASAEFRWRVHRFIEVAPFLDAGTVARGLSHLSARSVVVTPGVGLRGHTPGGVLGRLDWSHSPEGHRVTLGVGPAF